MLCLDGTPAADIVGATTEQWARVLWNSPRRDWHAEADTPGIRAAFAQLAGTCLRWPAPAKFFEVLPSRAVQTGPQLPAKVFTLEERRENLRKLREIGEQLLGTGKSEPKEIPEHVWASIPHPEAPGEEQAS